MPSPDSFVTSIRAAISMRARPDRDQRVDVIGGAQVQARAVDLARLDRGRRVHVGIGRRRGARRRRRQCRRHGAASARRSGRSSRRRPGSSSAPVGACSHTPRPAMATASTATNERPLTRLMAADRSRRRPARKLKKATVPARCGFARTITAMQTATALDALLADARARAARPPRSSPTRPTGSRTGSTRRPTSPPACPGAVALPADDGRGRRRSCASRRGIASRSSRAGAGTGLSGGAAGIDGALTIALTRMNRILEIDRDNLCVVTQPGVINAELKAAVAKEGLFYPPDPASYETCSIGGNLGHERRRAVLRQVRPDARLGARAGGRPRRRDGDPDRRPDGQGHGGLLADAPVRRLAGHARDHHRGDAPAPAAARAAGDAARVLRDRSARPATRSRR